jgi:succinate dehydrogenase / fumarate reductase cytochrome b subunit
MLRYRWGLFKSSIATKAVMAVTGIVLFLFIVGHLLGNLQIFLGREAINSYSHKLQGWPTLLWLARLGLLVALILHVWAATAVTLANRAARPDAYVMRTPVASTFASRTMMIGGLIILAFVLYHLAHFTFGYIHPNYFNLHDADGRHDVYAMVILGFKSWTVSALYIIAQGLLFLHLRHGFQSMFQTLGVNHPKYNGLIRGLSPVLALLIFVGYVSIPLAVLAGVLTLGEAVPPI